MSLHIGTAGWSLPKAHRDAFVGGSSILARYATRLNAVEINSSFYRPHKPSTYARWAASVPDDFRFAVKVPRTITHERRLAACGDLLGAFLAECTALGRKLGPLLVQLPPGLAFDADTAGIFFAMLRTRFEGTVVCEPRHATWFTGEVGAMLADAGIARVAADPARVPGAGVPGGDPDVAYFRWHGSPRVYYSQYDEAAIMALAQRLRMSKAKDVWCVFDNTALGHATENALWMCSALGLRVP